jgi:hypothetical protein
MGANYPFTNYKLDHEVPPPAMEMRSGSGSGSTSPTAAAGYMADPRGSVSFNGAMPVKGLSSSGASPVHGHGHGHEHAITGSSLAVMMTTTLVAGNAAPPLALLLTDLPTERIDHTQLQPLPPPTLIQTTTPQSTLPPTTTLPPAQPTAQSDPDLEVKEYGYGFGAASGSEYINTLAEETMRRQRVWNAERPERAREREAEWRLQQQQHMGRGFGGGGERGFGPSEHGGYGEPRGAPMPPPFVVMPPPLPHSQALMPGERKGRYWGIPGLPLQGRVEVQDSGVDGYYNPPPRQEQQQQQQLGGLFERSHGGFDQRYAGNSIAISQARAHRVVGGVVGGIGGVGVPAPLSAPSLPLDTTRYYLLGQLEYYLSPQNMARDFYLRKQVGFLFLFFSSFFIFIFVFLPYTPLLTFHPRKPNRWTPADGYLYPSSPYATACGSSHVQLVKEVLTLSSVVQVCGGMVWMDGWESFVLPSAPVSEVEGEGEGEGNGGLGHQQQGPEEQQQRQCEHLPREMVGSALLQGTRSEDGCLPPSLVDKNGSSGDDG